MKTVRVRRSRPSPPALALALLITMLCVYFVSLSAGEEQAGEASARAYMRDEIHMDALTAHFSVYARTPDAFAARAEAANCALQGGAGWILRDGGDYAVVFDTAKPDETQENGANILSRSAGGFTLAFSGPAAQVSAAREGVEFLRAMAVETGALAASVEGGENSVDALMALYKTRAERISAALAGAESAAAMLIRDAVLRTDARIDCALSGMDAAKIRLVHTAANAEWISLTEELKDIQGA